MVKSRASAKFSLFHYPSEWTAFLIIILTSVWASHGQESSTLISDEGAVILRWESDASLFRIQIRRDGQVFFDMEHDKNEIRLNLAPGLYEYRVAALNVFAKEDRSTTWLPLRVSSSKIPHFRLVSPLEITEGESGKILVVESTKFREDITLLLINGDRRISTEWQKDENLYSILLPDSLEAGRWDLEARDISGKTFMIPEVLTVQSTKSLSIYSLSVTELPTEGTFPVEIVGERFDMDMSLRFESLDEILKVVSTEVFNEKRALVYLDLAGAKPGDYTLIASNPNGVEARSEGALRVEPTEKSRDTEPVKMKTRVEFHAGYSPILIVFPDKSLLPVYTAVDIALLLQSGWEAPFLRNLGAETRVFGGISGLGSDASNDSIFGFDASAYYRPEGSITPVVLVGIGVVFSNYALNEYNMKAISVLRTGLGMDIIKNRWVTRIGISASTSFNEKIFPIFSLMLRGGLHY